MNNFQYLFGQSTWLSLWDIWNAFSQAWNIRWKFMSIWHVCFFFGSSVSFNRCQLHSSVLCDNFWIFRELHLGLLSVRAIKIHSIELMLDPHGWDLLFLVSWMNLGGYFQPSEDWFLLNNLPFSGHSVRLIVRIGYLRVFWQNLAWKVIERSKFVKWRVIQVVWHG